MGTDPIIGYTYDHNEIHKIIIDYAAQSPSKKRKVGAAVVHDHGGQKYTLLGLGFNHHPDGEPMENNGRTVKGVIHAEQAAIDNWDKHKLVMHPEATHVLVTHPPCGNCVTEINACNLQVKVVGDFLKFDSAKPRVALVPPSTIIGIAEVLTYGAKKYKPDNWRKTPNVESYISALQRHLLAWQAGEEYDAESGLHHLKHVLTNAAFLLELSDKPKIDFEK